MTYINILVPPNNTANNTRTTIEPITTIALSTLTFSATRIIRSIY